MQLFSSFINVPYAVPLILAMIIKRSPSWSAWSTILVGFIVSAYVNYILDPEIVRKLIGLDSPFTDKEAKDYLFFTSMILNVAVCSFWYIGTSKIFAKYSSEKYKSRERRFHIMMDKPVLTEPSEAISKDISLLNILGKLCLAYGSFIVLLIFIPNELVGRLSFVFAGSIICIVGIIMLNKSKKMLKGMV
jgi:hypothetical protein